MDIILTFLVLAIIFIVVVNTIYATIYKVANVPSMPQTRNAILTDIGSIKQDCKKLNIYDLGSGWGGLCQKLSKKFPKANIFGFEISIIPYCVSWLFNQLNFKNTCDLKYKNIFDVDLSDADILIVYLSPYHMDRLKDKIKSEGKTGLIIYSQGFPIKDWVCDKEIKIPYSIEKTLYRYCL